MQPEQIAVSIEWINASACGPPPKTMIVLGAERSGTSMSAQILHAIGVPMAFQLDAMGQDPAIADLYRAQNPPAVAQEKIKDLIASRNKNNLIWGWKFPGLVKPEFYNMARAPHFVAMFRDPLAMARRIRVAEDWRLAPALRRVSQQQALVADFIATTKRPILAVNYDESMTVPDRLIQALANFSSIDLTAAKLDAARSVIVRGNPAYIRASSAPDVFCYVDAVGPDGISGWARNRTAPQQRVKIRLSVDDRIVGSAIADTYRADLAATLDGDGKWAFSIPLPEALLDGKSHTLELSAAASNHSFKPFLKRRFEASEDF